MPLMSSYIPPLEVHFVYDDLVGKLDIVA